MAFFFVKPPCIRTPKSPISCGISCRAVAITVATPSEGFAKKLAAIISPSMKLCSASPIRFM